MTEAVSKDDTGKALEALQDLDDQITASKRKITEFAVQLEEVEEPALELEAAVENTRERLQEIRVEEKRLELAVEEKRLRVGKLEERLKGVRNVREESAVSAELDMVRAALEGDEQEALTLLEQIRKLEERLQEQEEALEEARAQVEPRRRELIDERERVESEIEELEGRRTGFASNVDAPELRMYERIRSDKGRKAVSRLTPDGACGHCFNVLPLQLQNEVQHGSDMIRCEACGVILAPNVETQEDDEG